MCIWPAPAAEVAAALAPIEGGQIKWPGGESAPDATIVKPAGQGFRGLVGLVGLAGVPRRVGISAGKKYFLPLAGLNRQKVAENGKNENDPLAHFTCFVFF